MLHQIQLVKGGWSTLSNAKNIFVKCYSCWLTDIGMAIILTVVGVEQGRIQGGLCGLETPPSEIY